MTKEKCKSQYECPNPPERESREERAVVEIVLVARDDAPRDHVEREGEGGRDVVAARLGDDAHAHARREVHVQRRAQHRADLQRQM